MTLAMSDAKNAGDCVNVTAVSAIRVGCIPRYGARNYEFFAKLHAVSTGESSTYKHINLMYWATRSGSLYESSDKFVAWCQQAFQECYHIYVTIC